ncbi:MAG: hypothetical protein V4438_00305 [Patescibacteria group bacterium]
MKINNKTGMGLVEVVIGSAILATGFIILIQVYGLYARAAVANVSKIQAAFLLEEGQEAVRVMRDKSWSSNIAPLTAGSTYYLYWNGTLWTSTTTASMIDHKFARTAILQNVYRDASQNIAVSGTSDANIKKIVVSVGWKDSPTAATTTKSVSTYLTNIFSN